MRKHLKILILGALASGLALSSANATDFSSMTTEELINLRGTVSADERDAFRTELQSRLSSLSVEERQELGLSQGGGQGNGQRNMSGSRPQDGTGNQYRGSRGRGGGGGRR